MEKFAGIIAASGIIQIAILQETNTAGSLSLIQLVTIPQQTGDVPIAYAEVYRRVASLLAESGVSRAFVKSSALPGKSVQLAVLEGAELRGVTIAAVASIRSITVKMVSKAQLSRAHGKVDIILKDDAFFGARISGDLKRGFREAALIVLWGLE